MVPPPRRGWLLAIPPDGRYVLTEHEEGSREEGTAEDVLQIVDLLTGEIQTVFRSESDAGGFGLISGNQGRQTNGDPDPVAGGRFVFTLFIDGARRLYSVRPGQEPQTLWTYPEEIIRTSSNPLTDPIGMPVGVHGTRVAWVRTNADLDFIEVTPETRSTLMVTDYSTGDTWKVLTLEGYLVGNLWSRNGTRIALEYQTTTEE